MAESVLDDDVGQPEVLAPCGICGRTFLPGPLQKHNRICEKNASKKRKIFNSLKQRVAGTDLAPFHQQTYLKKPDTQPIKPEVTNVANPWKEKHQQLVNAIRAAKGVTSEPVATPNRQRSMNMLNNTFERCPSCDRQFGPKAFDRHVEWCKERQTRLPQSPANVQQAKERLEARTKYRVPPMNRPKLTVKEKYQSPTKSEAMPTVKSTGNLERRASVRRTAPAPPKTSTPKKAEKNLEPIVKVEAVKSDKTVVHRRDRTPEIKQRKHEPMKSSGKRSPAMKINTTNVNCTVDGLTVSHLNTPILAPKKLVTWSDIQKPIARPDKHSPFAPQTAIKTPLITITKQLVKRKSETSLIPIKIELNKPLKSLSLICEEKREDISAPCNKSNVSPVPSNEVIDTNKENEICSDGNTTASKVMKEVGQYIYSIDSDEIDSCEMNSHGNTDVNVATTSGYKLGRINYGFCKHHSSTQKISTDISRQTADVNLVDGNQSEFDQESEINQLDSTIAPIPSLMEDDQIEIVVSTETFETQELLNCKDVLTLQYGNNVIDTSILERFKSICNSFENEELTICEIHDSISPDKQQFQECPHVETDTLANKGSPALLNINNSDDYLIKCTEYTVDDASNNPAPIALGRITNGNIGKLSFDHRINSIERDTIPNGRQLSFEHHSASFEDENRSDENIPKTNIQKLSFEHHHYSIEQNSITDEPVNQYGLYNKSMESDDISSKKNPQSSFEHYNSLIEYDNISEENISELSFVQHEYNINEADNITDGNAQCSSLERNNISDENVAELSYQHYNDLNDDINNEAVDQVVCARHFNSSDYDYVTDETGDQLSFEPDDNNISYNTTKTIESISINDSCSSFIATKRRKLCDDFNCKEEATYNEESVDLIPQKLVNGDEILLNEKLQQVRRFLEMDLQTENVLQMSPSNHSCISDKFEVQEIYSFHKLNSDNIDSIIYENLENNESPVESLQGFYCDKHSNALSKSRLEREIRKCCSDIAVNEIMDQTIYSTYSETDLSNFCGTQYMNDDTNMATNNCLYQFKMNSDHNLKDGLSIPIGDCINTGLLHKSESDTSQACREFGDTGDGNIPPNQESFCKEIYQNCLNENIRKIKNRKSAGKDIQALSHHPTINNIDPITEESQISINTPKVSQSNRSPRPLIDIESRSTERTTSCESTSQQLSASFISMVDNILNDNSSKTVLAITKSDCKRLIKLDPQKLEQLQQKSTLPIIQTRKTTANAQPKELKCDKLILPAIEVTNYEIINPFPSAPKTSKEYGVVNRDSYNPFVTAERQLMELLECDDFKPFKSKSPLNKPVANIIPTSHSKVNLKSLPNNKILKHKRASVIDPPSGFQDCSDLFDDNFELIENFINDNYNDDNLFKKLDLDTISLSSNKTSFSLNNQTIDENINSICDEFVIDPRLINEHDNLSIPEHLTVDDSSPSESFQQIHTKYFNSDINKLPALEPVKSESHNQSELKDLISSIGNIEMRDKKRPKTTSRLSNKKSQLIPSSYGRSASPEKKRGSLTSLKNSMTILDPVKPKNLRCKEDVEHYFHEVEKTSPKNPTREMQPEEAPTEELFPVDDELYEEYKRYEQMYLKSKEEKKRFEEKYREEEENNASKFNGDSAYGSLNRNKNTTKIRTQVTKLSPIEPSFDSASSSGSETSTNQNSSRKNISSSTTQTKFCHECGYRYPLTSAKFCVQCGVRRLSRHERDDGTINDIVVERHYRK